MTEKKSSSTMLAEQFPNLPLPAALLHHLGHSPTLQHLVRHGHPLTADLYLTMNHYGQSEDDLESEDADLIAALREWEQRQAEVQKRT
jgi:hypothetical protein